MANLDSAHDALVEAHIMTRDELEDSILYNESNFGKWARRYVLTTATGGMESFLGWCWQRYQAEHTPKHTEAWEEDRPKEYNFTKTWEEQLYGKEGNDER